MSVETEIVYEGGLTCSATHAPSKAVITTDAPMDNGGKGGAFSPTDLVAAAFGTCVLTIMGLVAERDKINIAGTRMKVIKEMASHPARRVGKLSATIIFPKGLVLSDLNRKKLEKTVETCPVKQSLHPEVIVEANFVYPQ